MLEEEEKAADGWREWNMNIRSAGTENPPVAGLISHRVFFDYATPPPLMKRKTLDNDGRLRIKTC